MSRSAYDVLIIGAGLAGQRAALVAAEAGVSVGIVGKVHPVRSHSTVAAGGINAALKPGDSWESHAYDTVKGSDYLGDQDAIELMCREAPGEIPQLDAIDAHADCLVTPCALCHLNLDLQQPLAAKAVERRLGLPVLHLPHLVGLPLVRPRRSWSWKDTSSSRPP